MYNILILALRAAATEQMCYFLQLPSPVSQSISYSYHHVYPSTKVIIAAQYYAVYAGTCSTRDVAHAKEL